MYKRQGLKWDDTEEDRLPNYYDDWYLPLIDAGKPMPDSIGADASADDANTCLLYTSRCV